MNGMGLITAPAIGGLENHMDTKSLSSNPSSNLHTARGSRMACNCRNTYQEQPAERICNFPKIKPPNRLPERFPVLGSDGTLDAR